MYQRLRAILLVLAAAWACGACVHPRAETRAEAVGPGPLPPTAGPSGLLRVYTPTETIEDQGTLYTPHRDYRVLSTSGEVVKRVRNADGYWDETPALVRLRSGTYLIRSRTARGDLATIPVVIERGRTTPVYLEGGSFRASTGHRGAYVELPDGELIGWAARAPDRP